MWKYNDQSFNMKTLLNNYKMKSVEIEDVMKLWTDSCQFGGNLHRKIVNNGINWDKWLKTLKKVNKWKAVNNINLECKVLWEKCKLKKSTKHTRVS